MIFAVVMPLAAMADSYTSLWKKYDAARAKDHPKTVLEVLGKISGQAQRAAHALMRRSSSGRARARSQSHRTNFFISDLLSRSSGTPESQ